MAGVAGLASAYAWFQDDAVRLVLVLVAIAVLAWAARQHGDRMLALALLVGWTGAGWWSRLAVVGLTHDVPGGLLEDYEQVAGFVIRDAYFPYPLSSVGWLTACLVAVPVASMAALSIHRSKVYRVFAGGLVLVSAFVMVHQYGMAWQVANTSFWVGAYLLWLSERSGPLGEDEATVGQIVVSFVFLGAFFGKLTEGYGTGAVPDALHMPSRFSDWVPIGIQALVFEGLAGVSFLLRPHLAASCTLFVVCGMMVSSSVGVLEAVAPLIGVSLATLRARSGDPR